MNDYLYIRSLYDKKIGFLIVLKVLHTNMLRTVTINGKQRQYDGNAYKVSTDDYLWIVFNEGIDFVIGNNSSSSATHIIFRPDLKGTEPHELSINNHRIDI